MMYNKDDEIWDEFQWEAHLKQMEQRNDQLREFFTAGLQDEKPRWFRLLQEYNSKLDVMNAYIEEELLIEESYFPDDEDWEDEDDEDDMDPFFSAFDFDDDEEDFEYWDEFFDEDELDEEDILDEEGEEWKKLTNDFTMTDYGAIENLGVYLEARSLGADILRFAEAGPQYTDNVGFTDFISNTLQISAKLAAGYSFGFEVDVLGANIAYCKRALNYANTSLELLQNLKNSGLMNQQKYYEIHRRVYELRNDVGVYVQDLRSLFTSHI